MTKPFTVWPGAMKLELAATYCDLSVETFKKVCPIKPIAFTESSRGDRYLKLRLDEWQLSLDPNKTRPSETRRFGDKLNGKCAVERA